VRKAGLLALLALCLPGCATPPAAPSSAPAPVEETALSTLPCGAAADLGRELQLLHGYARGAAAASSRPADRDDSGIAVLEDRGDLVIRRNPFDLDGTAVRFAPNGNRGFDVSAGPRGADAAPLAPLAVGTGEARAVDLPFSFPFFGRFYDRVFVQGDGSVAFDAPDAGSGPAGLGRFLYGPPRVAGFFTDLEPGRGGTVSVALAPTRASIRWDGVPGAGQSNRNRFEVALQDDGAVEMAWDELESREGIVGVSPGGAAALTPADLSRGSPVGSSGALAERFSESEKADLVSVTRRFLSTHPDEPEQIVVYTTRPLNPAPGTLAFEVNTKNDIAGIGQATDLDESAAWGSRGALASVVYMDSVDQYLDVDGFEILGHEVGHRWLTRASFRDASSQISNALLGRGLAHWSFFFNSDASVLEGNQIEPAGGGRFVTVDIARRYCALDQYLMGLRAAEEVPPFFYVDEPDDFRPSRSFKFSSGPEVGVSFTGIRRDVRIEDVVAALGPRVPDALRAPRVLRHAFVLVADEVAPATPVRVRALARIRSNFGPWFSQATDGRGAAFSELP
jgi:hypothetical protein